MSISCEVLHPGLHFHKFPFSREEIMENPLFEKPILGDSAVDFLVVVGLQTQHDIANLDWNDQSKIVSDSSMGGAQVRSLFDAGLHNRLRMVAECLQSWHRLLSPTLEGKLEDGAVMFHHEGDGFAQFLDLGE
jgi:hypothetical protein